MTTPIGNIDNTTLLSLTTNLDIGDIADPALRLAYFQYLNVYIQTITTAFNAFVANGGVGTINLADLSVTTGKLALLSVTAAQIALLAVGAAQLADGAVTNPKVATGIDAVKIGGGLVDNTEFSYLNGVTSLIQAQLDAKQALDSTLTALAAFNTNGLMKQTGADTFTAVAAPIGAVVGDTDVQTLTNKIINVIQLVGTLAAAQFPALTGDLTTVAGSLATTLAPSGVAAGSYNNVTVNAKGIVTFGQNLMASATQPGDMSAADKTKLDGLVQTGLAGYTVPADTYITFGSRFKVGYNSTTDTLDTYET